MICTCMFIICIPTQKKSTWGICCGRQLDTGELVPCVRECRKPLSSMPGLVCIGLQAMGLVQTKEVGDFVTRVLKPPSLSGKGNFIVPEAMAAGSSAPLITLSMSLTNICTASLTPFWKLHKGRVLVNSDATPHS